MPPTSQNHANSPGTSLYKAVERGDMDAINLLLDTGTDPNSRYSSAEYSSAERSPLQLAVSQGSVDIVVLLLKKGADPTMPYANGCTPLWEVTKYISYLVKIKKILEVAVEKKNRRHPHGPREDPRRSRSLDDETCFL